MLQELDKKQRAHAARRKVLEKELDKLEVNFEQVTKAVIASVEIGKKGDASLAKTPEELHHQARLLLENQGELTNPPHGTLHVIRPGERKYLRLPLGLKVKIGGREVGLYLSEPSLIDPAIKSVMTYRLGMGLRVGNEYMGGDIVSIAKDEVTIINGAVLKLPSDIQRVSKILRKAEQALSPRAN